MKTKATFNIDDSVLRRLREESARRRVTMSSIVEAALTRVLAGPAEEDDGRGPPPPLPSWGSGGQRVDFADREELYGAMEGE